jgi:hypothetical protein
LHYLGYSPEVFGIEIENQDEDWTVEGRICHPVDVNQTTTKKNQMPSTVPITNDPLLFDKLPAPLETSLQQLDAHPFAPASGSVTQSSVSGSLSLEL